MESKEEKPVLKCDNILFSSRGVAETHGNKVVIFVPATEIDRITLKFGKAEHRPMLSLSIGAAMALAGIFGLVEFITAPRGYRYELGMVAIGIIGASLIFDTMKQRYFLEVKRKKEDIRRLVFSKRVQRADIDSFCAQVTANYMHKIVDEVSISG